MRVIAGDFKGRRIAAPGGRGTRPTTDRVREALMSAIFSARGGFGGARVLDAFAGSGALGIEALSRGAASACFFEGDRAAFKVLAANIASLSLEERARATRADALKSAPSLAGKGFDLVFLDPPYAMDPSLPCALLEELFENGGLAADALVYYEHGKSLDLSRCEAVLSLQLATVVGKTYGDIAFDVLRREKA